MRKGADGYPESVIGGLRFLWRATEGHRLRPWESPYLRWRIETFWGLHADQIGFKDFWSFLWRCRRDLRRFAAWDLM